MIIKREGQNTRIEYRLDYNTWVTNSVCEKLGILYALDAYPKIDNRKLASNPMRVEQKGCNIKSNDEKLLI